MKRPGTRSGSLLCFAATALASFAFESRASAFPPAPGAPIGVKGQLAIDQISGFRVSTDGSLNYYGPIGFSVHSYTFNNLPDATNQTTNHYTSFWFAPSADYFVIDKLSVGGLLEISTTSSSADFKDRAGATQTISNPTTTNFTLLPRVGYMIEVSSRFAIWPRGGVGYVSRQFVVPDNNPRLNYTDGFHGVLLDADVGFLFRITDSLFFKVAPELSFTFGASHTQTDPNLNVERTADANVFQFAGVTGIGGIFDL